MSLEKKNRREIIKFCSFKMEKEAIYAHMKHKFSGLQIRCLSVSGDVECSIESDINPTLRSELIREIIFKQTKGKYLCIIQKMVKSLKYYY